MWARQRHRDETAIARGGVLDDPDRGSYARSSYQTACLFGWVGSSVKSTVVRRGVGGGRELLQVIWVGERGERRENEEGEREHEGWKEGRGN